MRVKGIVRCVALWVVAVVATGCGFGPKRWEVPPGGTTVSMSLDDNQPGVEVRLNGRGPYRALVDTGASPALAVTPQLARDLGLRRHLGHVSLRAANGRWVRGGRTSVRSLRLGDAVFHDVPAVILDIGEPHFSAVVGMGLFSRGVVTFDFPARQMSVRPGSLPADDPDTFAARFVYGIPLVPVSPPVKNGERTVHVLLDTGSNTGLVLPESLRDELTTQVGIGGRAVADTLGGTRTIDLVKLRGPVTLGKFQAFDPVVGLATGQGAMGTPTMRDFEVSIDQRSRRVRLKLIPKKSPATEPSPVPAPEPAAAVDLPRVHVRRG